MTAFKKIEDPFGHLITVPAYMSDNNIVGIHLLQSIITKPEYVIMEGSERLYFFKLIEVDSNLLLETQWKNDSFEVQKIQINPSIGYISELLTKGRLIFYE